MKAGFEGAEKKSTSYHYQTDKYWYKSNTGRAPLL